MKHEKRLEQYRILENDGTGPFEEDATSILIKYENQKPLSATLTVKKSTEHTRIAYGAIMRIEEDPSKLAKIVDFFNEK